MKQVLTGVCKSWYTEESVREVLKAQIDHSLNFKWDIKDILVFTDFDFEHKGVKAIKDIFPKSVGSNTKTYAAFYCYNELKIEDTLWCHDLDAWQFKDLQQMNDLMQSYNFAARMLPKRHRVQGASVFYSKKAKSLLKQIVETMTRRGTGFEEPALTSFFINKNSEDTYLMPIDYNVNRFDFSKELRSKINIIRVVHQVYDCIRATKRKECFEEFNSFNGFESSVLEALEVLRRQYAIEPFLNRELTRDFISQDRKRKRAKRKEQKQKRENNET